MEKIYNEKEEAEEVEVKKVKKRMKVDLVEEAKLQELIPESLEKNKDSLTNSLLATEDNTSETVLSALKTGGEKQESSGSSEVGEKQSEYEEPLKEGERHEESRQLTTISKAGVPALEGDKTSEISGPSVTKQARSEVVALFSEGNKEQTNNCSSGNSGKGAGSDKSKKVLLSNVVGSAEVDDSNKSILSGTKNTLESTASSSTKIDSPANKVGTIRIRQDLLLRNPLNIKKRTKEETVPALQEGKQLPKKGTAKKQRKRARRIIARRQRAIATSQNFQMNAWNLPDNPTTLESFGNSTRYNLASEQNQIFLVSSKYQETSIGDQKIRGHQVISSGELFRNQENRSSCHDIQLSPQNQGNFVAQPSTSRGEVSHNFLRNVSGKRKIKDSSSENGQNFKRSKYFDRDSPSNNKNLEPTEAIIQMNAGNLPENPTTFGSYGNSLRTDLQEAEQLPKKGTTKKQRKIARRRQRAIAESQNFQMNAGNLPDNPAILGRYGNSTRYNLASEQNQIIWSPSKYQETSPGDQEIRGHQVISSEQPFKNQENRSSYHNTQLSPQRRTREPQEVLENFVSQPFTSRGEVSHHFSGNVSGKQKSTFEDSSPGNAENFKRPRCSEKDSPSKNNKLDELTITIITDDHCKVKLSSKELALIRNSISQEIDLIQEGPIPRFNQSYVRYGGIIVESADLWSREWLTYMVPRLNLLNGTLLRVADVESLEKFYKATTVVSGRIEDPEKILRRLGKQNPELKTENWKISSAGEKITPNRYNLSLEIPRSSVQALEKINFKPYLGLSRIKICVREWK